MLPLVNKDFPLYDPPNEHDARGNVSTDENYMTSIPDVFTAGDMRRGQSLVVWAIAEGRKAAQCMDLQLMGFSNLP